MAIVQLGAKAEGSIIKLVENGALVDFFVARQNYESELNGAGRVLVVRKDCYEPRKWHGSNINVYAASAIDDWLNRTYKNLLAPDIQTAMGTTKFYYTPGYNDWNIAVLERSVFALSATELGQLHTYLNQEGTALSAAVLSLLKIVYINGSNYGQWTRSPVTIGERSAWALGSDGNLVRYSHDNDLLCTSLLGSRPAFTLPSTLYVSDDGSVSVNTAPGTPASISVPTSINGGTDITVSWGASTDAEGNLAGYVVERSTNGGSSWTQIYQGGALSTVNNVPFGTASVMYRVKAYDYEGLFSGYRTSASVTVINNTAPYAPASITVPSTVLGGGTLTVTWGAASDVDGNLAGYSLERQVNGGAWAVIYTGAALSCTDTITKGWASVAYRVRAYDSSSAYSGYATSPTRTVNNNTAPVIHCDTANGTDLGTKDEGFSVPYSVGDEDGDSVSVTEAIDGVTLRTFSAPLGGSNTVDVTGDTFMKLLNGAHTLTISASDGQVTAVHKLTFFKEVTAASITLTTPLTADDKITICVLSVTGFIPADAEYSVWVTNNANDDVPVWEDCTAEVRNGANHIFSNEVAAKGFAFNFKVAVERGESGQGGYITSVQGGFQ